MAEGNFMDDVGRKLLKNRKYSDILTVYVKKQEEQK